MPAVKFYSTMPSDNENVLKGISGKIPAEVRDTALNETYIMMTDSEFNAYMQSIQPELDAWAAIQANSLQENYAE